MINKNSYYIYTLVLFSLNAYAGDDVQLDHFLSLSLEELMEQEITISTDTKQTVAKAPAAVTVITEEDIKATGATNLFDVLESVPGIHVRASQFGFRPLIQFRGATANQTLFMINGVSLRDLMWGFGFFWKGVPTSSIQRIEIIRGPGSALFGADASAGVINVITKTAGKINNPEVGIRSGSFDSNTGWMQYGESWNGFDIGLTMDFHDTDGHDPQIDADAQTSKDSTDNTNASLAPDHARYGWRSEEIRFSIANHDWHFNLDYSQHSDIEIGLTGLGVLDPVTEASDRRYSTDLFYTNDHYHPNWIIDAELRYQDYSYTSGNGFQERPPGAEYIENRTGLINQMRSAERRISFETSGLYTGLKQHSLRLGVGYNLHDLYEVIQRRNFGLGADGSPITQGSDLVDVSDTPQAFAPEKKRKIKYLFLQDIWSISQDWEITAGARYDDYSDFGGTFNPRFALVWKSTEMLTSKLLYGRAFRPPSFQELYAVTTNALPNADLRPERSRNLELVFNYIFTPSFNIGLNIFKYTQTDLIDDKQITGNGIKQFTNIGEHTIKGIELEAKWQVANSFRLSSNYTFRDQDNSEYRAVDEPNQDAYLRADWSIYQNWNWNFQFNWIGERTRSADDNRPTLDDYLIADTTLRYSSADNWEFATSIRNLFDEDAREYTNNRVPGDLPLPERNYYMEIRYKFRH